MASSASAATVISSVTELKTFVSTIPPSSMIYLDLQGDLLSRHRTLSLITILVYPANKTRIIDISTLKELAFTTKSDGGRSLKSILEDSEIPKLFWSVQNDVNALWALYQVRLSGAVDIQVLENASRVSDTTFLHGLETAIKNCLQLKPTEFMNWRNSRRDMESTMRANTFSIRPVSASVIQYCTSGVMYLPDLRDRYWGRIADDWLVKSRAETSRRVAEAQSSTYQWYLGNNNIGPWGSGPEKRALSFEDAFERWSDDRRVEIMEEENQDFDLDDFDDVDGFDDLGGFDDDDGRFNSKDVISDDQYYFSD